MKSKKSHQKIAELTSSQTRELAVRLSRRVTELLAIADTKEAKEKAKAKSKRKPKIDLGKDRWNLN